MAVPAVVALHDEHIGPTDALGKPRADLGIGEVDDLGIAELGTEAFGYLLGQRTVSATRIQR